jgi:hypothetical protein
LIIDLEKVGEVINRFKEKKMIWIFGKFKVGKSFVTDYIRNDGVKTSDNVNNTIGLSIWSDDKFAMIDTEGMFQPIGENNLFFVRNFLINMIQRTADTVIFVSNQMDLTDLTIYKLIRSMYTSGEINEMYYIHNCRDLKEDKLDFYKSRVKRMLKLNEVFLDKSKFNKQVQHLFVPNIDSGAMTKLNEWWNKEKKIKIDFLGSCLNIRDSFSVYNYVESINDSLLSMGEMEITVFNQDKSNSFKPSSSLLNQKIDQTRSYWCKNDDLKMSLRIESSDVMEIYHIGGQSIRIMTESLDDELRPYKTMNTYYSPYPIVKDEVVKWIVSKNEKGVVQVTLNYVKSFKLEMQECCDMSSEIVDIKINPEVKRNYKVIIKGVITYIIDLVNDLVNFKMLNPNDL